MIVLNNAPDIINSKPLFLFGSNKCYITKIYSPINRFTLHNHYFTDQHFDPMCSCVFAK